MAPRQWRNRIIGNGEEDAEQLLANPRNWRIHPKEQQAALKGILEEVGWVQNVIVNQRTGFVVDGHARVAMAISAGEPVPVVYVDLSEQEEALVLATLDPLSAMAGKDDELLRSLIADIGDLKVAGVSDLLVSIAPPGKHEGLTDPDEVPVLPVNPTTRMGDIWTLGRHRLICGDSTRATDVEAVLAGVKPHLMVTDPPYGVEYDPTWRDECGGVFGDGKTKMRGKVANDDRCDWTEAWRLFPGDIAYVWHASLKASEVAESLTVSGFDLRAQIIWRKQHFTLMRTGYHWQHEPCWYSVRKGGLARGPATGHKQRCGTFAP